MKILNQCSAFLLISACISLATRPNGRSKDQVLHDLSAAVVAADGQAVLQLTDELKALVPATGKPAGAATLKTIREVNASSVFLARHPEAEESKPQKHFKTIVVTFKPGPIGITADFKAGKVNEVDIDSQAAQKGIKAGMILQAIDGEKYSEKMLDAKATGTKDFQITFAVPGVAAPEAKQEATSIFDDDIFQLTPEAKQDIQKDLKSAKGAEAVSWIKTGGWYPCAYETQTCKCIGQVKYGAPHTQLWSTPKAITSGAILCSKDIFGDPAPGQGKQCVCHRSGFTLTKNENSVSYMQEAWIFMLRFNARMKWLPFTGDRKYHGIELWSARHGGHTGGTLERYWIEKYIVEQYQNIPGGTCLEWGFYYVNWLSQCTNNYENKYEAVLYGEKKPSVEGNVVYGSIYDFPSVVGGASLQFNFICATELFEHLEKPYQAANALYKILAPGGAVLFTAPQQAQYHKVPQDFLRYTKEGVKQVMEAAGFCLPDQLMAGSGDFIFDVARNTGLQIQDFTLEELDEGYQRGYHAIADGAITIHAMAYKPPHALCR